MKKNNLTFIIFAFIILNFTQIVTAGEYPILEIGANLTSITETSNYPIIKLSKNISLTFINSSNFWDNLDTPNDIPGSEFWYNFTLVTNASMYSDYGIWWYNMTTAAGSFNYNETLVISQNFQDWFNANYSEHTIWDYNMTNGTGNGDYDYNFTLADIYYYNFTLSDIYYYNFTGTGDYYYNMTNYTGSIYWYNMTNGSNYYDDKDWIVLNSTNAFTFNESKLSTTYYDATQASIIAGTILDGTIEDTQHPDGNYDGITFNFSEGAGSPGLDLRINFTNVSSFNRGVVRYKTNDLKGEYPIVQMWNYNLDKWENYPYFSESTDFAIITEPVFYSSNYVQNNVSQMRIYKASNGNTNNEYYIDWVAVSKGYGTPSGTEVDPYSIHWDGSVELMDNWDAGDFNITIQGLNVTGEIYLRDKNVYDWLYNQSASSIIDKYINETGDTMTGNLNMDGANITTSSNSKSKIGFDTTGPYIII